MPAPHDSLPDSRVPLTVSPCTIEAARVEALARSPTGHTLASTGTE